MAQALGGTGSVECVTLVCASFSAVDVIATELLLFAGIWFFIGALDDLALDAVWFWQKIRYRRDDEARKNLLTSPHQAPPAHSGPPRHAVFIPAWDEADVIADMIGHCLHRWQRADYRLYIGLYANDPATGQAAMEGARGDCRVRIVPIGVAGPTSKADCLNRVWQAMAQDEREGGFTYVSVVLHDAEDVVHPAELQIYDRMLDAHAFVQLPVSPLIDPAARLISGHYADEFTEAHARAMPVRSRMGVAMPCAGVGCGFARATLQALADRSADAAPFATDSLTEDYELGIRIHQTGGRGLFLRVRDAAGELVATRAYFPGTVSDAVRQKTRWTIGIALSGWDRTGWGAGLGDIWMRARDRRAALSALVLVAGYAGLVAWLGVTAASYAGLQALQPLDPAFQALLIANGGILAWRIAVRARCTGQQYGWREALWSVPRVFVANIIAVMAARRAVAAYVASLRGARLAWDKTRHHIPAAPVLSPHMNVRPVASEAAVRDA
jgi:adsorption protein B